MLGSGQRQIGQAERPGVRVLKGDSLDPGRARTPEVLNSELPPNLFGGAGDTGMGGTQYRFVRGYGSVTSVARAIREAPKGDVHLPPILCLGVGRCELTPAGPCPCLVASHTSSPVQHGQTSGLRSLCLAPVRTTDVYQLVLCCSDHSFCLWGN